MRRNLFGFMMMSATVALLAGCPGPDPAATQSTSTATSTGTASTSSSGAGGTTSSSSSGGMTTVLEKEYMADATISGEAEMNDNCTVDKGVTLTFTAGAVVKAKVGTQFKISGTLKIAGVAGNEVTFQSGLASSPGLWIGVQIEGGGNIDAQYFTVHDADIGIETIPGGLYTMGHIKVDQSNLALSINSTGTIDHAALTGVGGTIVQIGQNGTASPKFTNSSFTGTQKGDGDLVRVRADQSSPSFDHCEVVHGRTGFRLEQGKAIAITATSMHDLQGAIDVNGTTKGTVTGSNFENNDGNITGCNMGSDITAKGCYFDTPAFDMSCMAMMNNTPSMTKLGNVGPM